MREPGFEGRLSATKLMISPYVNGSTTDTARGLCSTDFPPIPHAAALVLAADRGPRYGDRPVAMWTNDAACRRGVLTSILSKRLAVHSKGN